MDDYLKHTKEALKKITDEIEDKEILGEGKQWYPTGKEGSESLKQFMQENKDATFIQVPMEFLYEGEDEKEKAFLKTLLINLSGYYLSAFNSVINKCLEEGILFKDAFQQLSTTHQIVMSQIYRKIINEQNGDES